MGIYLFLSFFNLKTQAPVYNQETKWVQSIVLARLTLILKLVLISRKSSPISLSSTQRKETHARQPHMPDDHKFNILYVDDEPRNLLTFESTFRREYTIFTAQSGEEGVEIMRKQDISIVISDQRMPGMTGVEFFEAILPEFPHTIRMVLTGYSDVGSIIDVINKGKVDYFILKPWNADELKAILDKSLTSLRLKAENESLTAERNKLLIEAERKEKENEKQQKENILSQFEILKNQVNPHFLFNCLNSLASLVHDEPDTAEEFIEKLSEVYRYLLEHTGEELVSVQHEMNFIKDYFFLQKIRFGDSLQLHIDPALHKLDFMIPQLSLQLLIENAIKHNEASRKKPLIIELFVDDCKYLVVKNNYQKRKDVIKSTGIGLSNLQERYRFISDKGPLFSLEDSKYIAKIPLIPVPQS